MPRIDTLHINHFKFFADNEPIQIGGKHLLLYGENGSGKSSLYWALYTLLESVQKTDEHISRYFTKTDEASLVNIHAKTVGGGDWGAFIEATLTDGAGYYRIAVDDFSIKSHPNRVPTQRGCDFLNYRFMYKIHDFRHSEEIDLFDLFQKEVFPYINTRAAFELLHETKESQDFNEIWDDLKKGPQKLNTEEVREDDLRRNQKKYADKLRKFVEELNVLCGEINSLGNQLLQQELDYPKMRFEVEYHQKFKPLKGRGELTGRESDEPDGPVRMKFTIPEYDNLPNVVRRPQSFLNEAKLTAIGIAIRLAIIRRRLDYARHADFQVLVLDDMLLSLDMSNRRKVLDLLLTQYTSLFQLFILTHDRSFYHFAEKKIRLEYNQDNKWTLIEMYQDESGDIPKPYFAKKEQNLKKAEDYLNEHDYPACGLYIRRECERLLDELLPDKFKFEIANGETRSKDLNGRINSLKEFCEYEGIDYSPFLALKNYKDVVLNTLAHNDVETPLYRDELKLVLNAVQKLGTIKRGNPVLKNGKSLMFELLATNGESIKVSLKTRESFVIVKEENKPPRLSNFGKCEISKIDRGSGWVDEQNGFDDILTLINHCKNKFGVSEEFVLLDLLQYRSKPLRDMLSSIIE